MGLCPIDTAMSMGTQYRHIDENEDTMLWTNSWILPWVGGPKATFLWKWLILKMPSSCLQTECPARGKQMNMEVWSTYTIAEQFLGVDGFVDVRPQSFLFHLFWSLGAPKSVQKGLLLVPETNVLGIPFFPEVLKIKISCYNDVRITVWIWGCVDKDNFINWARL